MKTRTTRLTVSSPEGFFDVEIANEEGCGEFILVKLGLSPESLKEQSISISPAEWPHLREAIDRMVGEIEKDEDDTDDSKLRAFFETPAPWELTDGWIPWEGGGQPVDDYDRVDYRLRSGHVFEGHEYASDIMWGHSGVPYDIIAYKVVSEEKDD